jgi:hypothetical protein
VADGSRNLDQFVCVATSVYYNRDLEKERKDLGKEKRKDKWRETYVSTQRGSPGAKSKPEDMLSMWTGWPF